MLPHLRQLLAPLPCCAGGMFSTREPCTQPAGPALLPPLVPWLLRHAMEGHGLPSTAAVSHLQLAYRVCAAAVGMCSGRRLSARLALPSMSPKILLELRFDGLTRHAALLRGSNLFAADYANRARTMCAV